MLRHFRAVPVPEVGIFVVLESDLANPHAMMVTFRQQLAAEAFAAFAGRLFERGVDLGEDVQMLVKDQLLHFLQRFVETPAGLNASVAETVDAFEQVLAQQDLFAVGRRG